jgi:hypothetical protein
MASQSVNRNIYEQAIDSAFIRHISGLFDKYAADVEAELGPTAKVTNAPGARERFDHKIDIAIFTHSEMNEIMRSKQR